VWLPGYYIDVYPTSNADYARFVAATDHRAPSHWEGEGPPVAIADHPVTNVSWRDAQTYARWTAKYLPDGPQWEKAARGATGQPFPWGEDGDPSRSNVRESRIRTTTPVDWYDNGASPYGVFDLCGNVWEWCMTRGPRRTFQIRGGSYASPAHRSAPSNWHDLSPDTLRDDVGFRCVMTLEAVLELLSI
jgi:formylglycine-generating enzyme required for sulfatase activity